MTAEPRADLPLAGSAQSADVAPAASDDAAAVTVYDPAMCCPTGVCGPSIDPRLIRFATDLQWLQARGHGVRRYNLSQEPQAFLAEPRVASLLNEQGEGALPVVVVGEDIVSTGRFPYRDELLAALNGEGA